MPFKSADAILNVMFPGDKGDVTLVGFLVGLVRLAERARARVSVRTECALKLLIRRVHGIVLLLSVCVGPQLKGELPQETVGEGLRLLMKKCIVPFCPAKSNIQDADRYRL